MGGNDELNTGIIHQRIHYCNKCCGDLPLPLGMQMRVYFINKESNTAGNGFAEKFSCFF